jgi:hypothetical protein
MSVRFISVSACAALFCACLLTAGPASTADVITPKLTVVSPERLQRLNAAGLRADDPQLTAHLQALAASRHGALMHQSAKISGPRVTPGTETDWSVSLLPAALSRGVSLAPSAVVTSLALVGGSLVVVKGSNLLSAGGTANVTPNLLISNCAQRPLPLWSDFGETPTQVSFAGPDVPKDETAQLSTTVNGITSKAENLTYPAQIEAPPGNGVSDYVDYESPYFQQPDYLGQGTSSFATSGSHISTNFSDPTTTGTDTLGIGTNVLNGWKVTAQILEVHSYMDSPGEGSSSDVYRSAKILQQPANGRLETKVAWSYEGGESISYLIAWIFSSGPVGARQVSTMPKGTLCSDEQ